ncbi:MAG TPA: membrane protein insertase YidC [Terriglobales bacterium]
MPTYQNPQQEPGTEKRLLLVFAATFLIIILFQTVFKKYLPQTPAETPQKQTQAASQVPAVPVPAATPTAPLPPAAAAGVQAKSESEVVIENDLYRITFSNRGAQVKSWILKKFDDEHGKPLELVNAAAAAGFGYPLSLWTYDEGLRTKLNSALYVASSSGSLQAPASISFEFSDADTSVRKTFRFDHSYLVHVETSVSSKGSAVSAFPLWPAGFGDVARAASYASSQVEYQSDAKTERLATKKVIGGNTLAGPFDWAGVTDQYFAAVFLPEDPARAAMVTLHHSLEIPKDPSKPAGDKIKVDVLGAGVGDVRGATVERMYVGPKSLQVLESVNVPTINSAPQDLRTLVNFGFFSVIARPLFIWLKWTYKYVPNWGWAIIIQTLIINAVLLPLRISQMKSALKMQRVAPQIKSIQEKYKKYSMRDPRKQEMNKEVADIYKKEGVNPVGGCLPMLIQMPFLFAYYSMLGSALDLRHAPWLWIRDLSAPDPWYLLPIGIVITMFLTQRMTPQAGMDPTQQKMMTIMMPLFIGFISFNLAAGLCLYWSVGNLIAIGQQMVINRTSMGQEMREIAAKRARKKEK